MSHAIVLQHVACEGPNAIGTALRRRGIEPRVVRADLGEPVPREMDAAALVVMGGPMGVYEGDRHPHLRDELRLIETALRRERPVLGVCLGSQLLAAALGARVYASGFKEIGWYDVALTDAARDDALLGAAPRTFTALVWHGDIFDLPRGAAHLASTELTVHQAFRYGANAYGLLFHLEADHAQVEAMTATFADEIAGAQVSAESLVGPAAGHLAPLSAIGAEVFDRFAQLAAQREGA